jgi:1-acyl-sn-glycerol-3-phosphate acyltransferase
VTASVGLPRADLPRWQQALRYHVARIVIRLLALPILRLRLEGREHLVRGPALYCFNHMSWTDPLVMLAVFPGWLRLYFYGPREETMARGARNRLMMWVGIAVPFKPGKDDLLTSVRKAQAVFNAGAGLAIAGEGAIHVHEGDLLPFQEGAAYLALRAGVPIVPVAMTGGSWLGFRRLVRVRIGAPIPTGVRPTHEAVEAYTWRTWHALKAMVADDVDPPVPGRFGRWLTDLFNDWGSIGRAGNGEIHGPRPEDAPIGPNGEPRPGPGPGPVPGAAAEPATASAVGAVTPG